MNYPITYCQEKYGLRILDFQEFCDIMTQFALIDDRCQLNSQIMEQLFAILSERQEGQVTYASIETFIFDFLIQQPVSQTLIKDQDLGPQTLKLTRSMIDKIDQEMIKNLINFHKLCQSILQLKYEDIVSYSELESIGQRLQNQMGLSTSIILSYFNALKDDNGMIQNADMISLINELEKATYKTQKERISMRPSLRPMKQQQPVGQEDILNLSMEDDEYKDKSKKQQKDQDQQNSLTSQQKIQHYTNLLYKGLDHFRQQKQIIKMEDGPRILTDMLKLVQKIEIKALEPYKWNEDKNRLVEELYLERELVQSNLNSLQDERRCEQEQLRSIFDENDILIMELTNKDTQMEKLKTQIISLIQEGQSYSVLESEVRAQQLELELQKNKIIQIESERQRLQGNNKTLLEIIEQLEDKQQNQDIQPQVRNRISLQNDQVHQLNQTLNDQLEQMELEAKQLNSFLFKLEGQVQDAKREATNYKNLYDNLKDDNIQFRNSLMRPSVNFGGRESNIKYRQSNLGAFNNERQSYQGGRNSNIRLSNMGRISNINQFQNAIKLNVNKPIESEEVDIVTKEHLQLIAEEDLDDQQEQQRKQIDVKFGSYWDTHQLPEKINSSDKHLKEGFQRPGYNPEYNFLQFDENILYLRDYLGLRDDPKIVDIMRLEKVKYNQLMIKCFSDAVFRIDAKGQRSRRVLFSTEFNIYIFESEKNFKLTRQFPIEKIDKIIFSETSPILCCIVVKGSDDYLIETFKRVELNVYLTETLGERKLPLYNLDFKVSFEVNFKGFRQPKKIENLANGSYMGGSKQAAYKVSQKSGFLQMQSKKWFSKDWAEVFVMLCDVGLILFKKPGDLEPLLFVPIVDALVIKNPKSVEKSKPNMIKICYKTLEQEFLFSATSPALLDEWHDMINIAINDQLRQQSKQNTAQRSEIESQRSINEQK